MIVEMTEKEDLGSVIKSVTLPKLPAIYRYQKVGELHMQS